MKLGDLLLLKGHINKKQLTSALSKQADEAINYNRSVPLGKILIEMGHVSVDEISDVLNEQQKEITKEVEKKEKKVMPTEIGEDSKFTFDLKFMVTIGAVIVSACATYFSIQGSIGELKSNDSPNRLEYDYLKGEVDLIKSTGDLKLITYQLEEFKSTFSEIKELAVKLTPLASDLNEIKVEIAKLKNKKIPEVDLSGVEYELDILSNSIKSLEERITKLENKKDGGRF
tara:strand:+ start:1367 stop:2053 length:687 start_codon:yes stop_codon:yes gene_type:complete